MLFSRSILDGDDGEIGGIAQVQCTHRPTAAGESAGSLSLAKSLRFRLQHSADGKLSGTTVLCLMHIDQLAIIEQSEGQGPILIEAIKERLRPLAEFSSIHLIADEVLAVVFHKDRGLRASDCLRRVRTALRSPLVLGERDYLLVPTIGAASCPRHAHSSEELIRCAQITLDYARKKGWRGRHAVFTKRMANELADRLSLESDLLHALSRGELQLRYQPIVDLKSRQISGVEVLMRWHHPHRGFVPPDIFIPLAEQRGLIQPLTEWLVAQAARELQVISTVVPDLRMNINLSARQAKPALVQALLARVGSTGGIGVEQMTFEVTEGALLENTDPALEALHRLKKQGAHIALDDFGTGFSSISYLEQFPIDVIKIDKSFIQKIEGGSESRKLVEAMLFMASALELDSVAEGVESLEELAWLAAKGCRYIQGYFFAKPLDAEELKDFLENFSFPEEALAGALWPKAKGLPRLLSENQEERAQALRQACPAGCGHARYRDALPRGQRPMVEGLQPRRYRYRRPILLRYSAGHAPALARGLCPLS